MYTDPFPAWKRDMSTSPSSFNGEVSIRKYRVTVELLDEPKEVLAERLLGLWRHCDNHHHVDPLRAEARKLGIELPKDESGSLVRKTIRPT